MAPSDLGFETTLEDFEAFMAGNTRDILPGVLQSQQRVGPKFTAGSTGVPPANVDETNVTDTTPTPTQSVSQDDGEEADDNEGEVEDVDGGSDDDSTSPAPVIDEPVAPPVTPTPDLIEVSPGNFMTREAIAEALATRPPLTQPSTQVPAGGDGSGAAEVSTSASAAPTQPTTPTIPEELLNDPELGPFARLLQSQQNELAQQRLQLASVTDIAVHREQEQLQARVAAGLATFKSDKSLSDEDLQKVNVAAANLGVMPALVNGIDPITGEASPRDPQHAAYRALEIAYWQMPEFREREMATQVVSRAKDQRRKQKLAGVSGGSGSVPRTTPVPTDRRGREMAAVSELRELMSPGSEE